MIRNYAKSVYITTTFAAEIIKLYALIILSIWTQKRILTP